MLSTGNEAEELERKDEGLEIGTLVKEQNPSHLPTAYRYNVAEPYPRACSCHDYINHLCGVTLCNPFGL
jgi:hypothetical protein